MKIWRTHIKNGKSLANLVPLELYFFCSHYVNSARLFFHKGFMGLKMLWMSKYGIYKALHFFFFFFCWKLLIKGETNAQFRYHLYLSHLKWYSQIANREARWTYMIISLKNITNRIICVLETLYCILVSFLPSYGYLLCLILSIYGQVPSALLRIWDHWHCPLQWLRRISTFQLWISISNKNKYILFTILC